MDLLKFQASLDAHTAALNTHSGALEKFMAVAASGGAAVSGEAPRGRGRPTNAEKAAANAQTAQGAQATSVPAASTVGAQVAVNITPNAQTIAAGATAANAAAANAQTGPLTHQSLAPKVVAFGKSKGRDALVALLGEFGATEFAKVPADALPLFNDRLDGKPQTPTIASDLSNLLGM